MDVENGLAEGKIRREGTARRRNCYYGNFYSIMLNINDPMTVEDNGIYLDQF